MTTTFQEDGITTGAARSNCSPSSGTTLLNTTYAATSPTKIRWIFAAWVPLVGRFVEAERFYVNALLVEKLHPYTEWAMDSAPASFLSESLPVSKMPSSMA